MLSGFTQSSKLSEYNQNIINDPAIIFLINTIPKRRPYIVSGIKQRM